MSIRVSTDDRKVEEMKKTIASLEQKIKTLKTGHIAELQAVQEKFDALVGKKTKELEKKHDGDLEELKRQLLKSHEDTLTAVKQKHFSESLALKEKASQLQKQLDLAVVKIASLECSLATKEGPSNGIVNGTSNNDSHGKDQEIERLKLAHAAEIIELQEKHTKKIAQVKTKPWVNYTSCVLNEIFRI